MNSEHASDFPIPIEKPEIGNQKKEKALTSQKQIEANRLNAQLSTGPKTEQGKAVVARNTLKHGIFAKQILVEGESEKEFKQLEAEFLEHFQPQGLLETLFWERALAAAWRLSRVMRMEAMLIDSAARKSFDREGIIEVLHGYRGDKLSLLSRYEITLEKIFFRALGELRALQFSRRSRSIDILETGIGFVS